MFCESVPLMAMIKTSADMSCDTVVLGLGAMGSAAAFHLAARGQRVIGLEQFAVGHDRGSSHGKSRIIRTIYTEEPSYVPLVQSAFGLWRDLERRTGQNLLTMTGGLDIGPAGGRIVTGAREACRVHGLRHEFLTAATVNARFPAFKLPPGYAALYSPDAGILRPEACIQAHCQAARDLGAVIRDGTPVADIEPGPGHVTVRLENGERVSASHLVVAAGPWIPKLFPEFRPHLQPERQVVGWFPTAQPALFTPDRFPVFILEENAKRAEDETTIGWYGFPSFDGDDMKFACYGHRKQKTDVDTISRVFDDEDRTVFQRLQPYFAAVLGTPSKMSACMFTYSPDHHFVLGFHPRHDNIYIASPCSGHGFKFASVIGEIIADQVMTGTTRHDVRLHNIDRLRL